MTEIIPEKLFVCSGDITKIKADAVVNAANSSLLGGGGVDGAIHAAGGKTILAACRQLREHEYPDGLPTGEAAATTAGNLPASWVIHTVGPVWKDGNQGEEELLGNAYRNSLAKAEELGCASIAFPAISTGIYGFPKDRANMIALREIKAFLASSPDHLKKIYLVFFSDKDEQLFLKTAGNEGS